MTKDEITIKLNAIANSIDSVLEDDSLTQVVKSLKTVIRDVEDLSELIQNSKSEED